VVHRIRSIQWPVFRSAISIASSDEQIGVALAFAEAFAPTPTTPTASTALAIALSIMKEVSAKRPVRVRGRR
jgi:hypothetical protein